MPRSIEKRKELANVKSVNRTDNYVKYYCLISDYKLTWQCATTHKPKLKNQKPKNLVITGLKIGNITNPKCTVYRKS